MQCLFENFGIQNQPQLKCKGDDISNLLDCISASDYDVVVDGIVITSVENLVIAVQTLFEVFYIFNIEYPINLCSFFTFLQKEVIGLQDSIQPLPKLLKLVSVIHAKD